MFLSLAVVDSFGRHKSGDDGCSFLMIRRIIARRREHCVVN